MVSGGGQITLRPHLLSRDGKLLLVCVGNDVRCHSTATSELLMTLKGHKDEVTSLALHPTLPTQVYSASLDGTIALWDLQGGESSRVQVYTVGEPVESLVVTPAGTAFVSFHWGAQRAGRVAAFDFGAGALQAERAKTTSPRQLVASASGRHIAAVERHSVLVWSTEGFKSKPLILHHTRPLTCVAISPDDARIAAGDTSGRIVIWHNLAATVAAAAAAAAAAKGGGEQGAGEGGGKEAAAAAAAVAAAPAATVHWHAHAVGCLAFSVDGAYLLSGGQEAVLVMWDAATGRRTYLPRLGGPLTGLAPCLEDPAKYALRQADNTIRVVNMATMCVESSLHGLRPPPAQPASAAAAAGAARAAAGAPAVAAAVAVQPGSGHLVVAGPHAVLQFYDALRDAHVDRLQVSARNLTSLTETDAAAFGGAYGPPIEPAATAVAFSADASVMATVEVRPDVGASGSTLHSLKFWERPAAGRAQYGQPYLLNTLVDTPHRSAAGSGDVTALAYHPATHLACTTSAASADFRVWARQRVPGKAGAAAGHTWRCAAVGSYRGEPMHAAAFSSDGSLLAVAAGAAVTLWDAQSTALLGVLPPPAPPAASGVAAASLVHLAFLKDSPYLVAGSATHLTLYNLLTKSAEWCHPLPVAALAVDFASQHFAVILPGSGSGSSGGGGGGSGGGKGSSGSKEQPGAVLVFKGGAREPVAGWALRRPAAASAVFALPRTPLHSGAAAASLPGMSPLLVISQDRQYAQAGTAVQPDAAPAASPDLYRRADSFAAPGRPGAAPAQTPVAVSGLEAMYGTQQAQQAQQQKGAGAAAAAAGGTGQWAGLFDAPSHVLPPLSALCPAFLELVVSKEGGVRADQDMQQ